MKQPLPLSISAALADVERIADDLAATACDCPAGKFNGMSVAACLDNLDQVAAALTWKELEQAPAMLNAVARAFRQNFPSDSLGWEDAGRLQTIAYAIEQACVEQYMKENPAEVADFYHKQENPFSNL
jgi:hypothetical protein